MFTWKNVAVAIFINVVLVTSDAGGKLWSGTRQQIKM